MVVLTYLSLVCAAGSLEKAGDITFASCDMLSYVCSAVVLF